LISISTNLLLLATAALLLVQAVGMQMAKDHGGPRGYWLMSTLVGLSIAAIIVIFSPQVI
jgi:hypothetical protein